MEAEFSEKNLKIKLKKLDRLKRFIFLLLCCERQYPNYVFFSKKYNWGDPSIFRKCLDFAWLYAIGKEVEANIEDLIILCEKNTPDVDNFNTIFVSSALDAAVSVTLLLQLINKDSIDSIIEGASLSRDSIDMYVQELENMDPNDENLEDKILSHSLMQKELKQQRDDIELLTKLNLTNINEVISIKNKYSNQLYSNIGLRLLS